MLPARLCWPWLRTGAILLACGAAPACDDSPEGAFSTAPLRRAAAPVPMELTRAIHNGSLPDARALLARGADPNAKDPQGRTALHAFFSGRNWKLPGELLEALLDQGARPDERDPTGATALHLAAKRGRPEYIKRLCSAKADPNARDKQGRTPLHEAASHERSRVASALIGLGARVDAADNQGRTPLHLASDQRDWATAHVLMTAGADPQTEDDWGQRPIQWLAGTCVDQLQAHRAPPVQGDCTRIPALLSPSLHLAAAQGNQLAVSGLLERGADPADRHALHPALGSPGSALHAAAATGRTAVVRMLLEAEVTPDCLDVNGWTPLHLAAWKGHREVVASLLAAGAAPDRTTRGGQTARELATRAGHSDILTLLKTAPRPAP